MNAQLSFLVQLQQFDLKIHQLNDQQQKVSDSVKAARLPLDQANAQVEEITAAMEKIAADRRRGEQDLDEQESHVHKIRARLMELKTNKEYQAHLFEIDIANKKKNAIEEKVLLAMEQGEAKQNELKEVQKLVDEAAQSFSHKKTDLKSQAYERDQELQALKAKKEEILQLLDKPVLTRYTTLQSTLSVVVVAPVRGGTCQGCQLQVPPQLVAEVRRADQLLTCPYCFRILYAEDSSGAVPEFSSAQEGIDT